MMTSTLPTPSFFPDFHYKINDYLALSSSWPTVYAIVVAAYYFTLDPVAAVSTCISYFPPHPPSPHIFLPDLLTPLLVPLPPSDGPLSALRNPLRRDHWHHRSKSLRTIPFLHTAFLHLRISIPV